MIQRIITFVAVTAILALVASADDTHGAPSLPMNPPPSTVQLAQETLVSSFQTSQNRKLESKGNKKEDRKVSATESKDVTTAAAAAATSAPQEPAGQQQQQQAAQDSPGTETDKNRDFDGSELVEWITSNGGFIHPNARIGLDPTGNYRGVFVKDVDESDPVTELGIADDEVICRIPWSLLIKPKSYEYKRYWSCDALHELHNQFLLGDESKFAPYVKYLLNQPRGRIPSEWTSAGKNLLNTILGKKMEGDILMEEGLPPNHFRKGFQETWIDECGGEDTPIARAAYYQFTSRDEDTLMVPFYDMCNHSNDLTKLNTISVKPRRKGKPFILRANRDIAPNEQLFISYNRCNRCWSDRKYKDCTSWSHYGTTDLYDIFGFVEDYPQTWNFPVILEDDDDPDEDWDHLTFCLEREDDGTLWVTFGDNYSEDYEDEVPNAEAYDFLSRQLTRLNEVKASVKSNETLMAEMPSYEWAMAWEYHSHIMTAIAAAILASDMEGTQYDRESDNDEDDSEDDSEDDEWGSSRAILDEL